MKKAVTLTEILIGAVILSLVFASLLATFVGVRRYIRRANRRLIAMNLAKLDLNDLYREVNENTWNTGGLQAGTTNIPGYTIDRQVYQDTVAPLSLNRYIVTNVPGQDYRRVRVILNFPD